MQAQEIASKGEFAALCNVSPGRVSQWISEGKIGPEALVGEGRSAKIRIEVARRQLNLRRDLAQSLGNGLGTRLSSARPPASGTDRPGSRPAASTTAPAEVTAPPVTPPSPADLIDEQIRQEKLWDLQAKRRDAEEREAARRGRYTETAAVRREMATVAVGVVREIEGGLPEIAGALAAEFRLDQRDVLHVLRAAFRAVREKGAARARARADQTPERLEAPDLVEA